MAAQRQAVQDVREDLRQQLIDDVRAGLSARPKTLPARWFYDRRGSDLFLRSLSLLNARSPLDQQRGQRREA